MKLKNNEYYFILPNGIGDSLIMHRIHSELEDKFKSRINYIIKASHKYVFGSNWNEYCITNSFSKKELLEIAADSPAPNKGRLFVAHPAYHNDGELDKRFLRHEISFIQMYGIFLGLEIEKIEWINDFKKVNTDYLIKVRELCGTDRIEDVVLYAPEMNSGAEYEVIQPNWANRFYEELKKTNKYVLYNATKTRYRCNQDNQLSVEELVAIGMDCRCVITSRSGLADILYGLAKSMKVIYPNIGFYDLFRLDSIWTEIKHNTEEFVLDMKGYFVRNGYKRICIYGYGEGGQRVRYSLEKEGLNVSYAVDRKAISDEIKIYRPDELLPEQDIMIVCVKEDRDKIVESFKYPFTGDVVGMGEIMNELKMPVF